MAKALACKCGDCTHWEILRVPTSEHIFWRALEAITPNHGHPVVLKCKTCQQEFPATMAVDTHHLLSEVDVVLV